MTRTRPKFGMTRLCVSATCLLIVVMACGDDSEPPTTAPSNNTTTEQFTVALNAINERPTPVITTAVGSATLSFAGTGDITYTVTVTDLTSTPLMAHIHGPADADNAADIIVALASVSAVTSGELVKGSISQTDAPSVSMDSLKALLRNGHAYLNVHTVNNPGGEIRGQVSRK